MKDMGCLTEVTGQGLVSHELAPTPEFAKLGLIQNGQVGYSWGSMATCHLVMGQN